MSDLLERMYATRIAVLKEGFRPLSWRMGTDQHRELLADPNRTLEREMMANPMKQDPTLLGVRVIVEYPPQNFVLEYATSDNKDARRGYREVMSLKMARLTAMGGRTAL